MTVWSWITLASLVVTVVALSLAIHFLRKMRKAFEAITESLTPKEPK